MPSSTAGSSSTGTTATVANCNNVNAVMPDAAVAVSMPASLSIRTCSVAPAAAPAGRIELSAFAASCDVTIANHCVVRVASRSSIHTMKKLIASHTSTTTIHPMPDLRELREGRERVDDLGQHEVERDRR